MCPCPPHSLIKAPIAARHSVWCCTPGSSYYRQIQQGENRKASVCVRASTASWTQVSVLLLCYFIHNGNIEKCLVLLLQCMSGFLRVCLVLCEIVTEAFIWVYGEKFWKKVSCADIDEAARAWHVSMRIKCLVLRKLYRCWHEEVISEPFKVISKRKKQPPPKKSWYFQESHVCAKLGLI